MNDCFAMLPEAVRLAFHLAGVVPVFIPGLDEPAWLSSEVKSHGHALLLMNDALSPDEVASIADQALSASAERLGSSGWGAQSPAAT